MSRCSLIEFNGNVQTVHEFSNSWGGAARIWQTIYDKHVVKSHEYDGWMSNPKKLWALARNAGVPAHQRAVLASTFDYAVVKRADFQRFASDLREFNGKPPCHPDAVNHLPAWADLVEKSTADCIGFMGTSVSGSLWDVYEPSERDDDDGTYRPYDFDKDSKAFDVYGWQDGLFAAPVEVPHA